jgi:hypothetical protein
MGEIDVPKYVLPREELKDYVVGHTLSVGTRVFVLAFAGNSVNCGSYSATLC